jgi:acetyl-CoA carboxylase carboxyl transferase subunit alpha
MAEINLDFEKPIIELEKKLREWVELSKTNKMELGDEVSALKKKLTETMKNIYDSLTPWQRVQLARHPERPYTLDYIKNIFTDFMELHGDRRMRDDAAIVGGFAKLDGIPVMIIGTQKGRNTKENVFRNFGWPHPEGYRKALRLMQLADRAKAPIITFIDTPGAFPGIASEERHIGEAIAINMREMFGLKVPVISVIIGEGGSGGAIGIGVGNRILILENSYYSVITPEGCAAILWNDRSYAEKAAEALNLTANDLKRLKVADEIVAEPLGGAHKDPVKAAELLKASLKKNLTELKKMTVEELMNDRYDKFRAISVFTEGETA